MLLPSSRYKRHDSWAGSRSGKRRKKVTADTLKYIHDHKTGSLFMASILAGIILEDPPDYISRALKEYGSSLGLAFQVVDDILDVTGNSRKWETDR